MSSGVTKNIAWNMAGTMFYLVCNWITTVLVVTLSPDYYASGSLAVAMSVGNVFSAVMLFKVRTVQVADVDNVCIMSDYTGHRVLTFAIAMVTCIVYSFFTVSSSDFAPVIAYLFFKAGDAVADVLHGLDQKHDRFDWIGLSHIFRGIFILVGFIVGLVVWHNVTAAIILMAILNFVIIGIFDIRKSRTLEVLHPRFVLEKFRYIFAGSTAGFLSLLACTVVVSLTRQLFALKYGNESLGVYAALAAPAVIVQAFASYVYVPLIKPIAIMWKKGKIGSIFITTGKFTGILIVMIGLCILLFNWIGAPVFQFVFQKDVSSEMYLMTPLLISTGTTALVYYLLDLMIIVRERIGSLVAGAVSLLVIFVVMNQFFVQYGANGISWTIIAAQMVYVAIALLFVAICVKRNKSPLIKATNDGQKG